MQHNVDIFVGGFGVSSGVVALLREKSRRLQKINLVNEIFIFPAAPGCYN
jgi:hypothetical protein